MAARRTCCCLAVALACCAAQPARAGTAFDPGYYAGLARRLVAACRRAGMKPAPAARAGSRGEGAPGTDERSSAGGEQACEQLRELGQTLEDLEACGRRSGYPCLISAERLSRGAGRDMLLAEALRSRAELAGVAACFEEQGAGACYGFGLRRGKLVFPRDGFGSLVTWHRRYDEAMLLECGAGEEESCYRAQEICRRHAPEGPDRAACEQALRRKAWRIGRQACDRGDAQRCFEAAGLARFERQERKAGGWAAEQEQQPRQKGLEILEGRCGRGDALACTRLADRCAGERRARYFERAAQAASRGCRSGEADGCYALAGLHLRGAGAARRFDKAVELLGRACELGLPAACHALATIHLYGLGGSLDIERAERYARQACALRYPGACERLVRFEVYRAVREQSEEDGRVFARHVFEEGARRFRGDPDALDEDELAGYQLLP